MNFMQNSQALLTILGLAMVTLSLCVLFARLDSLMFRRLLARDQEARTLWARRLGDATFDGLLVHRNGMILAMNHPLVRLLGCRERELVGQHFTTLAHPDQIAALRVELEAPRPLVTEFTLLHADKTEILVEMTSQTIEHEGSPATVTAIRDVTAYRAAQARIDHLLNYDQLTGLVNRAVFSKRLDEAVELNDNTGGTTALFVIDLDRFKAVNEQIGRSGGDTLLRQIAGKLTALTHETDTVARISGDKFGIIQLHTGAPNRMASLASQLDAAFNQLFVVDGQMVKASISIGMAVYPDHATNADSLMRAACFALEKAHEAGGGCSHVFNHAEAQAASHKTAGREAGRGDPQRLTQDLRAAVRRGEISLEYQPVFNAKDLSLTGFEALARWNHPVQGWVPPAVFIPLAEQAGLIHDLGAFVLETACKAVAATGGNYMMAVNLSPLQFKDPQLASRITGILEKTGLPPAQLELEVTESLLIDNAEAAQTALQAVRSIGVSVALDDFGTGYSSFSYLCDFPFTRLKIDKRFVQSLGRDANADAIVGAILSMARNLSLEVTAEGVETPAQLAYLQERNCSQVQGFLLGRPGAQVGPLQALVNKPAGAAKPALVVSRA
jgi:diguanylate cyclase (GGDEF)-like protein/PAS domain S-box-containing protein